MDLASSTVPTTCSLFLLPDILCFVILREAHDAFFGGSNCVKG